MVDFVAIDVIHRITVRFVRAFLPNLKKAFHLKAVDQSELDIHGIASKAQVYNISTSPKVIEEGLTAGFLLMRYLAADGFRIKTPLFKLRIRIPGEYNGSETALPNGVYPVPRLQVNQEFSRYIREKVQLMFNGVNDNTGLISDVKDEATGTTNDKLTKGNMLTIKGRGLKIESDKINESQTGVFFRPSKGNPVKVKVIAVNQPRTLKVLIPAELVKGTAYTIGISTMSSYNKSGKVLKTMREFESNFTLVA